MTFDNLVDIHAHVLPGLDDGPAEMSDSIALLRRFQQSGVDRVFCTSHYHSPHFDVPREAMAEAYKSLTNYGRSASVDFQVPLLSLGAEVRLTSRILDDIRAGTVPTLGSTHYVLVEFPTAEIPKQALDWVYELRIRGLRPIMAHPERVLQIQSDVSLAGELVAEGLLLQLTASCFTALGTAAGGPSSKVSDNTAWTILNSGWAGVLASDTHGANTRPPVLQQAYQAIADTMGEEVANGLRANAEAIWADEECEPVRPPAAATLDAASNGRRKARGGQTGRSDHGGRVDSDTPESFASQSSPRRRWFRFGK